MDYKGYIVTEERNRVIVEGIEDFNPIHIFECGQCFRWYKQKDRSYTGVVKGKVVNVRYSDGILVIINSDFKDFIEIWFDYFDLGRDYSLIKEKLAKDEIMKKAIEFGYGIRILRQDLWETLISFIISANNRIPMIMKVVSAISEAYGDEIVLNSAKYYAFPYMERLANTDIEQLRVCKGGFRCKYIIMTSMMIKEGVVELNNLSRLGTDEARMELMKLPGVGKKVADCTLLYSGTKYDVFPTDLWVKRVMEELYFRRQASFNEIQDFAKDYFGEFAGLAQQYLFYYARENKIGAR